MHPYCSRCFKTDPEPVISDTDDKIYWFKIHEDLDGEESVCAVGLNTDGEISAMFVGISNKDFEYDESFKLLCPDCVIEDFENSNPQDLPS